MTDTRIPLGRLGVGPQLADVVREARRLVGWSQRELADRAVTSQATIWRIEAGRAKALDLGLVGRVLTALGIRSELDLEGRHLTDRRRQQDGVHARLNGYLARRLTRAGWRTATGVPIGDGAPRGWIDLLGYRPADQSLLIDETKTQLDDLGALQRSLSFYEREAMAAARRLGWEPRRSFVVAVLLDTDAVIRRVRDARDLVTAAFPAPVHALRAWIEDPSSPPPRGWSIAIADPAARGATWLRPIPLGARRRASAYVDYADAASRLLTR
jgi:transcriptional regulator with XRE-family HTH domain